MSATHLAVDDLIHVPGGEFLMGQADGRDEEKPVHGVTLAPFRICRYPVTNGHWEEFRKATGRDNFRRPAGARSARTGGEAMVELDMNASWETVTDRSVCWA